MRKRYRGEREPSGHQPHSNHGNGSGFTFTQKQFKASLTYLSAAVRGMSERRSFYFSPPLFKKKVRCMIFF